MKISKDNKYHEIKLSTLNTEKSLWKLLRILTKKTKEKKRTLYQYLER